MATSSGKGPSFPSQPLSVFSDKMGNMSAAGKPPHKDTTDSLFDALQAAKGKKQVPPPTVPAPGVSINPPVSLPIGKPILLIAALVLLIYGLIWGLTRPRTTRVAESDHREGGAAPLTASAPRGVPPPPVRETTPMNRSLPNGGDLRRRQQIENERDQRLAREKSEREAQERERQDRERELERERETVQNEAPPIRPGETPPEEAPPEEGLVSRMKRERALRSNGDEPPVAPEPFPEH